MHSDETCKKLLEAIEALPLGETQIMEVCGTHTMAIAEAGIRSLLPQHIRLISGPGCPVCVTPPEDYAGKEIDFGCAVQFDGIEITLLYFSAAVNSKKKVAVRFARKDCRRAFVSYSHKDKARVVQRLLAIQEVAPKLKFWMDNQSMNAGDVWRSAIASAIKNADVFLLFWSLSARESAEVRKEWEFALVLERQSKRKRKNGARFISPVPLDSPSECPPPEELGDLHFGDPSFDSDIDDIERVKFWSESGKRGNIRFF